MVDAPRRRVVVVQDDDVDVDIALQTIPPPLSITLRKRNLRTATYHMAGEEEFGLETDESEGDITTASSSGSDTELDLSDIEAEDNEDVNMD